MFHYLQSESSVSPQYSHTAGGGALSPPGEPPFAPGELWRPPPADAAAAAIEMPDALRAR